MRDEVDGEDYLTVIDYFMVKVSYLPQMILNDVPLLRTLRGPWCLRCITTSLSRRITPSRSIIRVSSVKKYCTFPTSPPILTTHLTIQRIKVRQKHPHGSLKYYLILTFLAVDAQIAGKIIVDMTRLRDEGIILPIFPVPDEDREMRGKVHYKVEYDLVAIVEGRNLRYEARYPANHLGQVQKTGQISIAAAFKPGTG